MEKKISIPLSEKKDLSLVFILFIFCCCFVLFCFVLFCLLLLFILSDSFYSIRKIVINRSHHQVLFFFHDNIISFYSFYFLINPPKQTKKKNKKNKKPLPVCLEDQQTKLEMKKITSKKNKILLLFHSEISFFSSWVHFFLSFFFLFLSFLFLFFFLFFFLILFLFLFPSRSIFILSEIAPVTSRFRRNFLSTFTLFSTAEDVITFLNGYLSCQDVDQEVLFSLSFFLFLCLPFPLLLKQRKRGRNVIH